jgi:hypothetical protein
MNPLYQFLHEYRWHKHGHHCHPHSAARAITSLALTHVFIVDTPTGARIVNISGTFTAPVTRKDNTPLALTDINFFSLTRNGTEIQKLSPTGPVISFIDTTPITGSDDYEVFTVTLDGFTSDASNDALVTVVAANPATAISDLTAKFNP